MKRATTRGGFTLIELLTAIVVIGILAVIAMHRLWSARDNAYVATMTSDLRNLVVAQELYFGDQRPGAYGMPATSGLSSGVKTYWVPSVGVTVKSATAGDTYWSAEVAHHGVGETCRIWYGESAAPAGYPSTAGEPGCS